MGSSDYLSFNIDEVEGNDGNHKYKNLIEDLRNLSAQNSAPHSPLLHIDLITGKDTITLKIEPDNLYVRGYFAGTNCWEFSDSSLIPGAKPLPYPLLLGADALYRNSSSKASPLGYVHLRDAISHLANYPPPPPLDDEEEKKFAKSIIIIMQMITEAAKIQLLAEHVANNWCTPTPIQMEMRLIQTAFEMGNFTTFMQSFLRRYSSNSKAVLPKPSLGVPYVLVKGFEGDIYGTVTVEDTNNIDYVAYEHFPSSGGLGYTESEGQDKHLLLTGPSVPVFGCDPFSFKVSLRDCEGEVVDQQIWINPRKNREETYNKDLVVCASGRCSSVSVGYSIISSAFFVTIKVVIFNDDGESSYVYGKITASYLLRAESKLSKRILFSKSDNECVKVSPQESILPLTCSAFPVPEVSNVEIKVDLSSRDGLFIASGLVKFPTLLGTHALLGTQLADIRGPGGGAQVSFTCFPPYCYDSEFLIRS